MSKPVLSDDKFKLITETRKKRFKAIQNLQNRLVPVDFRAEQKSFCRPAIAKLVCKQIELYHLPFWPDPSAGLPETAEIIINLLTERQIYGSAFAFSAFVRYYDDPGPLTYEHMKRSIALRKKVEGDMAKYKEQLQPFKECLAQFFQLRSLSSDMVFPLLDVILDETLFHIKGQKDEVEYAEEYWMHARKRLNLTFEFFDGKFKLLRIKNVFYYFPFNYRHKGIFAVCGAEYAILC